jgi:hypothetical protein
MCERMITSETFSQRLACIDQEAAAVINRHQVLRELWPANWISNQVGAAAQRYPHPAIRLLLQYAECGDALAHGIAETISTCRGHSDIGALPSRLKKLKGSRKGTWRDDFIAFWTTLCELKTSAFLIRKGFHVRLLPDKAGPDIVVEEQGSPDVYVEVHSPQSALWSRELEERFHWIQGRHTPHDLTVRAKVLQRGAILRSAEIQEVDQFVTRMYEELDAGIASAPRSECLLISGLNFVFETGEGAGWAQTWKYSNPFGWQIRDLIEELLERAKNKSRQLTSSIGVRVFLVDCSLYDSVQTTPMFWPGSVPEDIDGTLQRKVPSGVDAIVFCSFGITTTKPWVGNYWVSNRSKCLDNPKVARLLESFRASVQVDD